MSVLEMTLSCVSQFAAVAVAAPPLSVIFKMGDDLRQDNVSQIPHSYDRQHLKPYVIQVMLKLFEMCEHAWLQEGLEMRLRLYACTSTASSRGIIQVRGCWWCW